MSNQNQNPLQIIINSKGRFVSVTYTKKDGSTNRYTVRTGVRKYVNGTGKFPVPNSVTVFCVDQGREGYKTFLQEGIRSIKIKKETVYTT